MAPDPDDLDQAIKLLTFVGQKAEALKRIAAALKREPALITGLEAIGAAAKLRQVADELDREGAELSRLTIDHGVKAEFDHPF